MTQAVPESFPPERNSWVPPKVLLDALEGLPTFDEMGTLRECARMIERQLGVRVNIPDSTHRRTYLLSLLTAVHEHPEGLRILGSVVDLVEGDTHPAQRVRTAIAVAEVPLFTTREWAELTDLLAGLVVPDLPRLYQQVMAYRGEPAPPAHCTEPWLAVLHAATFNARPGEPLPCVRLVACLARYAKGVQGQRLAEWAAEHGAQPDRTRETPEPQPADGPGRPVRAVPSPSGGTSAQPRPVGGPPGAGPLTSVPVDSDASEVWQPGACLLIRVRPLPDPDYERERLLTYWWGLGPSSPWPVRGEDIRVDVDRLPEQVQTLVEQAESDWAYFLKDELALEFFLPRDLLELPVEQWPKKPLHGASGTIGEDHPVLLRSLDRLERFDTHGRWGRRWDALVRGQAGRAHWFPEDGKARLLMEPLPAVVVLSSPPRGNGGWEAGFDELGECLRVGVPIVIWDRRDGQNEAFRRELADLLAREGVAGLPEVAKTLRIMARDDDPEMTASPIGHHMALLWDDPYRLPENRDRTSSFTDVEAEGESDVS